MRSALALLLLAGLSHADSLPDGLRLEVGKARALYVVRGKDRGRLPVPEQSGVLALKRVRYADKTITLDYLDGCDEPKRASWPLGAIEARLENAVAYRELTDRQLTAAQFVAAVAGFRKAIALDDRLDVARTNLASALVRRGDRGGALAVLQPLMESAPIATYAKVAGDADLARLLETAPFTKLRGAQRGNATVTAEQVAGADAAAPHAPPPFVAIAGDLLALGRVESGWGEDCDSLFYVTIVRASDGAVVTDLPLGGLARGSHDQCVATPGRDAHVLISNRVLADLGFDAATFEVGRLGEAKKGERTIVFSRGKLGVVAADKVTRVLSGDRVVTTAPALPGQLQAGYLLPDKHLVVLGWVKNAREGCEGTDLTGFGVLRLP